MAGRRMEPVSYRPFRTDPQLADGLLAVARPGGELMERVSAAFFRLADEAGQWADQEALRRGKLAGGQAGVAGSPHVAMSGGAGDAAEILRREEGFREKPYWDVNAWRVGYGSDTITRADGSVVKVTKDMRVSREDAERDLQRRLSSEFGPRAAGQVGADTWNKLPRNVRAALGSVAYNYGSLPGSVVNAARGGDVEAIAGAVESLSANKGRRQREAAIIRTGVAPGGDATFTASGGSFRPMAGNTLYARAYNEAGQRTYLQMLDTEMLSVTSQAFELYKDDPAKLEKALGALKGEMLREHVFPEIAGDFEVAYGRLSQNYMEQGRKRLADRLAAQDRAEFVERTNTLTTQAAQQAAGMDPDDPAAADVLAATQRQLEHHYDAAVDRGILAPDEAARAKIRGRSDTAAAFYGRQTQGRSAEEIGALRQAMAADWAAGKLTGLDEKGWQNLDADLQRQEAARRLEEATKANDLRTRGQRQLDRVAAGFAPDPDEISRLRLDQSGTPDGPEIVEKLERKIEAGKAVRDLPLPEARAYVEKLRGSTGKDASDTDIAVLAYAEERLGALEALAAKDPVGYEIATGRLALSPIALGGSDEELEGSLAARLSQMRASAERGGRPLELLRPGERTMIARMMKEDPAQMPRLVKAMRNALGAEAATALAEVAPEAPALAHAAGVSLSTGDDGFVEEVAQTLAAKARGELKLKMPAAEKFAAAAGADFAKALGGLGGTRAATLQTAQLIYEREANLLGFNPDEVNKEGTTAAAQWNSALNRALGRRIVGGRRTGGLGEVNGRPIVVPTGMDVDQPQQLLSRLSDAQLEKLPKIWSANGIPITAAQLRRGYLVTAGDGRFRVALGDPDGFEPRWVIGEDGAPWTLDLNEIARDEQSGTGFWRRTFLAPDWQ